MGPGKDTHGTLGPISGKAVGGPNTVQHSSTVQKHDIHFFHFFHFFNFFRFFLFFHFFHFPFFEFFSFFNFLKNFLFFFFHCFHFFSFFFRSGLEEEHLNEEGGHGRTSRAVV